jgi:hypothetical protein
MKNNIEQKDLAAHVLIEIFNSEEFRKSDKSNYSVFSEEIFGYITNQYSLEDFAKKYEMTNEEAKKGLDKSVDSLIIFLRQGITGQAKVETLLKIIEKFKFDVQDLTYSTDVDKVNYLSDKYNTDSEKVNEIPPNQTL